MSVRVLALIAALVVGSAALAAVAAPASRAAARPTRIFMSTPATLDPAVAGDAGSSAFIAQLFEGLTAIDTSLTPRPALARGWELRDGGKTIVFTLRDGLQFSDGTPLTGADVVRSWLRVVDPQHPSPLVSLLYDVVGVRDYVAGRSTDQSTLGFSASGNTVTVHLTRPAGDFPAIAASPTLAVVPPRVAGGGGFVGSGGYMLSSQGATGYTLTGNPHYWAGPPAISQVQAMSDFGGAGAVDAFLAGDVDWTPIGSAEASWIAYDKELGPELRSWSDMVVTYYGFDTRRPPFDDARVRRAFAEAVDWKRTVRLADGSVALPATSMVPPGMPGRSDADFQPAFDPAGAKQLLAAAGYADPSTFPTVTLVTTGTGYDGSIVAQLKANLGITVKYESNQFSTFFGHLGSADSPQFWALGWVADYPSPYDFLGILLGSNQPNNYGHWSSAAFDDAMARASATTDLATIRAAYDQAEAVVRDEVPVIPVAYAASAALSRAGLLGAATNGLGILRLAGLAWAPGTP